MSKRITESASVAVVYMYWMIHYIKWSLKKKIKNDISKEEKFKSETQIKIIKVLSVQTDHRVSKISSNACIEWPIALNDHWIWKSKIKFEISQVEKIKSEYQKKSKAKNVRKNFKCRIFPTLRVFEHWNEKIVVPRLSVRFFRHLVFFCFHLFWGHNRQTDRLTNPFI